MPGNYIEEVEIKIHQTIETMHYWFPYANSFILPAENEQVEMNMDEAVREVKRLSPEK